MSGPVNTVATSKLGPADERPEVAAAREACDMAGNERNIAERHYNLVLAKPEHKVVADAKVAYEDSRLKKGVHHPDTIKAEQEYQGSINKSSEVQEAHIDLMFKQGVLEGAQSNLRQVLRPASKPSPKPAPNNKGTIRLYNDEFSTGQLKVGYFKDHNAAFYEIRTILTKPKGSNAPLFDLKGYKDAILKLRTQTK